MHRIVLTVAILLVAAQLSVINNAARLPAELYWQNVLPHTPMPSIIHELMTAKRGIITVNAIYRPLYYESTTTEFPSDPNLFFLEEELHSGAETKPGLSFLRTISGDAFLPRAEAEALPFSSNELMQILKRLSIPLDSQRAKEVEVTLHDCEAPAAAAAGDRKYCATSLESMIDFVTSELKTRDIEVAATTTSLQHGGGMEQAQHDYYYRIAPSGPRKMPTKLL